MTSRVEHICRQIYKLPILNDFDEAYLELETRIIT